MSAVHDQRPSRRTPIRAARARSPPRGPRRTRPAWCWNSRGCAAGLMQAGRPATTMRRHARLGEIRRTLQPPAAIDQISARFGLSDFERQIVLLAAGIEMDSTLATLCSEAMGRERRAGGAISFSLALGMLDDPHWSALAPAGPLRRHRLVELEAGQGLTQAALRIDERILHYLAGVNRLDARLEPLLRTRVFPQRVAEEHLDLVDEAFEAIELAGANAPALHLCGDDPRGQEDVAACLRDVVAGNCTFYRLRAWHMGATRPGFDAPPPVAQFRTLWVREAALLPAVLLVQCGADMPGAAARQLIERLPTPLIIASRAPMRLDRQIRRFTVNKPSPASQKYLWTKAIGVRGMDQANAAAGPAVLKPIIDALAGQFRLSAEAIATVGSPPSGHGGVWPPIGFGVRAVRCPGRALRTWPNASSLRRRGTT